jgi:hypothetical protein
MIAGTEPKLESTTAASDGPEIVQEEIGTSEGNVEPGTRKQRLSPRDWWVLRGYNVRIERLPYVPGFGGHRRRWQCKCVVTDEAVGGRVSEPRESERKREMRLRGATVIGAREARVSAWLAELAGHDTRRLTPSAEVRRSLSMRTSPRVLRELSDEEWREALRWARKQRLNKVAEMSRQDICAQFWIELRTPPADAKALSDIDARRQAWERARMVIRNETSIGDYYSR